MIASSSTAPFARFTAPILILAVACGRSDLPPAKDSVVVASTHTTGRGSGPDAWTPELGAALLVPSDSDSTGILLYPADLSDVRRDSVTLLTAAGDSGSARLDIAASDQMCGDAAIVRIIGARPAWSAAVVGMAAHPLHMDSIEALSAKDSARLATDIARLASGIRADSDADFRGLPFVVVAAHTVRWTDRDVLVAHLVRRLNQEASPREEHTLLIAERAGGNPFAVVFSERSRGSEETAEHFDALATFQTGTDLFVLLARDQDARTRYDLLDRTPDGGWRVRWTRTVGC